MEVYEEIKKNREAGARRLVDEYRSRLTAAARLLCGDDYQAEDLVFRTFEQAIRRIGDFRPTGSFYYWMYTILLNFHRMDLRKKARRPEILTPDSRDADERSENPFAAFAFRGSAVAVRNAVQRLPENFREVVVLRYFEDMSTGEIAKIAGIPEGTVRSRLHYAKDALYAMLSDTELAPDFTERLIRSTAPKGWLFRRGAVAALAALLGFAALAVGATAAIVGKDEAKRAEKREKSVALVGTEADTGLYRMVGGGSTFTTEADAIDRAVESGLKFIAASQQPNGTFGGDFGSSAAIPALAGMAYLSKGHLPGTEPYGKTLLKCLDYVLSTADLKENAQFRGYMGAAGNGRMYAHSIATLFLSEMSGMVDAERQAKIDKVLPLAVKVILDAQNQQKSNGAFLGGWRYMPNSNDADLSCSGWALMALRSARLNGVELPEDAIEKAVLYVKRTQRGDNGAFSYQGNGGQNGNTLSGAGILSLELCGKHLDPSSIKAANYVRQSFRQTLSGGGYIYYALYYHAQGLFQIGGDTWQEFQDWMYTVFMKRQKPDGRFDSGDINCPAYTTSMAVLALTVPYRMLPIYQRDETVDGDEREEPPQKQPKKG